MKNQSFISALLITLAAFLPHFASGQCPSSVGIVGTPVVLNGNCYLQVQFAIPNSTVSIYNTSGLVIQGQANSTGNVVITYPCSSGSISNINSIVTSPSTQVCNESTINPVLILPVKLVYFSGELNQQNKVIIKWGTTYEFQNEKFEIEKSLDGINYKITGTVASSETSITEKNYQFEDATYTTGSAAFYRLKQTDIDGKISLSKVVYINDEKLPTISAFPNPLQSSNIIMLKGVPSTEMNYSCIRITNLAGTSVSYKITGSSTLELPQPVASGVYLIRINDKVLKLVKE